MKSSNLWGKIAVFLFLLGVCAGTAMALSGSGTEEEPWLIQSLEDFDEFASDANYWDDYTRLETDVNLAGRVYERAVIAWDVNDDEPYFQGTAFTGVFDGNDHRIMGLTIEGAGSDYIGLVGLLDTDGEVENLGVEGGSVSGDGRVGNLVGQNSGEVSNCYSVATVMGEYCVGGLVGENWHVISKCYSRSEVSGVENIGGLAGGNAEGITVGIGNISNCYSAGNVSGNSSAGGLVGHDAGFIGNCYSASSVTGDDKVGGLTGDSTPWWGTGVNFWDIQVSGIEEPGAGEGRSTAEMMHESTYEGYAYICDGYGCRNQWHTWDFINVWNIGENQTYPYLRTHLPSDLNKDNITNFLDLCIVAEQWCEEQ